MLFFKPKPKSDELLPPPPPPTDTELEKEFNDKNEFFDEVIEGEPSPGTFPEEEEFIDVVEKFDKKAMQKKAKGKLPAKKQKTVKKEAKNQVKITNTKVIEVKASKIKPVKSQKVKPDSQENSNNIEGFGFDLQKELTTDGGKIELPDTLEEFDSQHGQETENPDEILEARQEIRSAIDRIKELEKPSILRRLFGKKKTAKEQTSPEPQNAGEPLTIQDGINKTRLALMKFDLDAAKKSYMEVMKIYNNLKPEEQAKVYQDIKEIYFERKSAEKLKV
ncbi:hypothetical protein HYW20_00785 [Candidatus Woesearchaeota archaeon]|nr:hypothetical protein [Candidatus Woesearchaeota archaeon]